VSSFNLVNVWVASEPGPGGYNPMVSSMLWLPDEYSIGDMSAAIVYVHRWGGYPYDPVPVELGPELADKGFGFLSLALRRRGMEGQLTATPDDDHQDIKLAIDYLQTNGFRDIYLVGEQVGGVSAIRYMAKHRDKRVTGISWLKPVAGAPDLLRSLIGEQSYGAVVKSASVAARQGAGMDTRIDLFPDESLSITQQSMAFLGWWGPMAETGLVANLAGCGCPLQVLSADVSAELRTLLAERPATTIAEPSASVAEDIAAWAVQRGGLPLVKPPLELVHLDPAEGAFFGLLWSPADLRPVKTVVLLMHGLTSSPLSPLFLQMAPILAQSDTAVLAVEVHRSGWAGHETSVLDNDLTDLDAWVDFLLARGFEKIVLAGASIGSISVGRYQSVRQHPNVAAIAHLMPTADCPDWFRQGAGEGPYALAVEQAQAAVAAGRGEEELIDVDVRQPPPSKYGGRFRWTQRAASWLSWWGPDADSRNSRHIANVEVPLLLLSGTDDSYNDEARFAELKAAAIESPDIEEIWYPDIDHGLAGVEVQVAVDMRAWMKRIGVI
jgi:alpha-beta hydrolase superfamily lysophospholipase